MNLIERLFGGRGKSGRAGYHTWPGQSGKEYPYKIFPIGTVFRAEPGNYILAMQDEAGGWTPLYIAQTRDLHQRAEGSEKQEHAVQQGATHIHVHISAETHAARCGEERDLILRWQPVCNDSLEG